MRLSRPRKTRVANHAKLKGRPTPAATAARIGDFSAGGWPAEVMVQFTSGFKFKGGDVEVEEGKERLEKVDAGEEKVEEVDGEVEGEEMVEEVDANVEGEEMVEEADANVEGKEKAETADDN